MLLQAQMRLMKQHADDMLDSILNHPNLTEPQISQMDTKQKEELRLRVKAADDVTQPAHFVKCTLYVDIAVLKYYKHCNLCHAKLRSILLCADCVPCGQEGS